MLSSCCCHWLWFQMSLIGPILDSLIVDPILDPYGCGLDVLDLPYYYNLILISVCWSWIGCRICLLDSWVMRRSIWIFTDVINWLSLFGFFSPLNLFFWFHSRTTWSNSLISQLHIFDSRVHNANDLLRSLITVYVES